MSRIAYFLFTLLLLAIVYGVLYMLGGKYEALVYMISYFSVPLVVANFLMAIGSLLFWFTHRNDDVSHGGMTFLHATWIVAVATFAAYKIINAGGLLKLVSALRHL